MILQPRADPLVPESSLATGVPRSQENASTYDPPSSLCIGPYDGPGGTRFLMSEVSLYFLAWLLSGPRSEVRSQNKINQQLTICMRVDLGKIFRPTLALV